MAHYRRSYTAVDPRMYYDDYVDDMRPSSRASSRVDIIPINNGYRNTVSTQTECDEVDLPTLLPNEKSTLVDLPDFPRDVGGGYYTQRRGRSRPASAMSRTSYEDELETHRSGLLVPYNQYFQRLQDQQRVQIPVEKMSHGKPSELCRKFYGNREPSPPAFKAGRLGAPWRHIKQTTGNLGNHICFVDGIVKETDMRRFPPYGYYNEPEPVQKFVYLTPRQRAAPRGKPSNTLASSQRYNTRYNQHAKNGFRYWYQEKRPKPAGISKQSIHRKMQQNCVGF